MSMLHKHNIVKSEQVQTAMTADKM